MEQFAPIYQKPVYPKNQYLDNAPTTGWGQRDTEILAGNIERLQNEGVLAAPVTGTVQIAAATSERKKARS